tara:strand:- start:71655 stop:72137 length:483 start_codon:yes stop_codon:yes gene_type:complete
MTSILLAISGLVLLIISASAVPRVQEDHTTPEPPSLNRLIDAIQMIESGPKRPSNMVFLERGAAGEIGPFQILPIMMDEMSNCLGVEITENDLVDYRISRQLVRNYFNYICMNCLEASGKLPTEEYLARLWNGGYNGVNKVGTLLYWKKVKEVMESYESD